MSGGSPKYRPDERAELVAAMHADYDTGLSIRLIVVKHYASYTTVHRWLQADGVTFRPRGGNHYRSEQP